MNTKKYMGSMFLPYNSKSNNCQVFIQRSLTADHINTPAYDTFVKQDTARIFNGKSDLIIQ